MLKFIKKYLAFILTGSFSFILAACYGAPVEMAHFATVKAKDGEGNPIQGLKVSLNLDGENQSSSFTNADGVVDLHNVFLNDTTEYIVSIEDIDGKENGGEFELQEFAINENPYYEVKMKE